MLDFVRLHPEHLVLVRPQAAQEGERGYIVSAPVLHAIPHHIGVSAFAGPACIGCAGLVDVGDGVAMAWAYLSADARHYMLPITRKVRQVLELYPARRIEATVAHGFEQGGRWLLSMGFRKEADSITKPYHPPDHSAALYVRKRHVGD